MKRSQIRVLDLFAGAGGLTAGFHQASSRFKSVAAVEMDLAAAASYEATFGEGIVFAGSIQDWLKTVEMPAHVDIIVGGPPCQGFSTLGKQDAEDVRNTLWQHYAEAIVRLRPKYFVVENVAAFAASPQFLEFTALTETGSLKDYAFQHKILNAADFGAPQARKRAVIIGHRRDLEFPGFPEPTHEVHRTVGDVFAGVTNAVDGLDLPEDRSIEFAGKTFAGPFVSRELHLGRRYTEQSLKRFSKIPAGGNRFDIPVELLSECWKKHKTGSGDVMGRLHNDKPSVTIRTEFFKPEKGRYLHPDPKVMRAITHYEAALLQGFPADHQFIGSKTSIARQIGNAVPIPLGKAIGKQLLSQFR
ncbi:DNA cytosine methyltransferase [Specibacter sp. NPDC078692]|uniref:DNA cytosine methyltransferase n=1 Tax=Specibacter sp. NPDC078692 TaxID=3155818 RepID=UPI003412A95B